MTEKQKYAYCDNNYDLLYLWSPLIGLLWKNKHWRTKKRFNTYSLSSLCFAAAASRPVSFSPPFFVLYARVVFITPSTSPPPYLSSLSLRFAASACTAVELLVTSTRPHPSRNFPPTSQWQWSAMRRVCRLKIRYTATGTIHGGFHSDGCHSSPPLGHTHTISNLLTHCVEHEIIDIAMGIGTSKLPLAKDQVWVGVYLLLWRRRDGGNVGGQKGTSSRLSGQPLSV